MNKLSEKETRNKISQLIKEYNETVKKMPSAGDDEYAFLATKSWNTLKEIRTLKVFVA